MAGVNYMSCCGLAEITSLSQSKSFSEKIQDLINNETFARRNLSNGIGRFCKGAFVFTSNQRTSSHYASQFANAIVKHKLGTVTRVPSFNNPNTGNKITTYVWVINQRALKAFCKKHNITPNPRRYGF
jgi:hypothetical protein